MDNAIVGMTGVVIVPTRGAAGPGEVLVRSGGGSQTFLARSDEPIGKGTTVLVVEDLGARTVVVIPFSATN
jgi:membrane protein implicated in regulation of membrane protease activity